MVAPTERSLKNQEKTHSVSSRQKVENDRRILDNVPTKSPVNWPKMNEEPSWKKLDDVVSAQLSNHGDAHKRINVLENVIYEEAVNLFGDKEKETKGPRMPSRRQKELGKTVSKIKDIEEAFKQSESESEKDGINAL